MFPLRANQILLRTHVPRQHRLHSILPESTGAPHRPQSLTNTFSGLRERLMNDVKSAMKNKDTFASITLRSVLSEVYAADKSASAQIPELAVASILRKAILRRHDSAALFTRAARPELAERESKEAAFLATFLPPLLAEAHIDRILRDVITADPRKSLGQVFKAFYAEVDKSAVDTDLVKKRAEALLSKDSESSGR